MQNIFGRFRVTAKFVHGNPTWLLTGSDKDNNPPSTSKNTIHPGAGAVEVVP